MGVIHNGINLFENAITVLGELKKQQKNVVLISNAPRSSDTAKQILRKLKFDLELMIF